MRKLLEIINKYHFKLLLIAIVGYIILFSALCIWKYDNFYYNSLDLAIFNQTIFNTSIGDLFNLTIHPHSYLGDHFTPFLIFLIPFYIFLKSPITLLVLQSIFLGLGAIPIYFIAKNIKLKPILCFLFSCFFLLNPFIHNINLFEFHIIPFAIFFLLFAFYFYQKEKFILFLIFLMISLLVREDVALFTVMFGILKIIDLRKNSPRQNKKIIHYYLSIIKNKWVWVPILVSAIYFIIALKISGSFNPAGEYKFLYYYSWLGNSFGEIIKNLFLNPLLVIKHILNFNNLEMILGLLLPLCAIPILKPKYIAFMFLPFIQIILTSQGGGALVLYTHYASLFIPALFIATIYAIKNILSNKNKISKIILKNSALFKIIFFTAILYSLITMSSLPALSKKIIQQDNNSDLKNYFLKQIPKTSSVAATYEFLPALSTRKEIYSMHYAFIGKTQYAHSDYKLPPADYLLIDTGDFIDYKFHFSNTSIYTPYYSSGDDNLRKIIQEGNYGAIDGVDGIILLQKNAKDEKILSKITTVAYRQKEHLASSDNFRLLDIKKGAEINPFNILPISIKYQATKKLKNNYFLEIILKNSSDETVYKKIHYIGYGIYPTSEWNTDEIIEDTYYLALSKKFKDTDNLYFRIIEQDGIIALDKIGSSFRKVESEKEIIKSPVF